MRIQHVHHTKQQTKKTGDVRFKQGQIVRGHVVQLYPHNQARIQFGSSQFIAQVEAPLEHGERYYFQVQDVKNHVHLRVIQQPNIHENNEWQQLLTYTGIKQTKLHEQFIQKFVQEGVPFTKRSLQRAITLLSSASHKQEAMDTLINMMQRKLPLTNELFQSLNTYRLSTLTDEIRNTYESIMNKDAVPSRQLMMQLEAFMPEERRINQLLKPLHQYVTTQENLRVIHSLRWVVPQIDMHAIREIEQLSLQSRTHMLQSPFQLLDHLILHNHTDRQLTIQTFQALSEHVHEWGQRALQFAQTMEQQIQRQTTSSPDEQTRVHMLQMIHELMSIEGFPKERIVHMRESFPSHTLGLTQMISDFKELANTMHLLVGQNGKQQDLAPRSAFHLFLTQWMEQMGLSYERLIVEGETKGHLDTLKGQLLQFIQAQGIGSERAQSLLHYIQGMQLQTVQETPHMLYVNVHIPALIGALRSDIRLEFESKKTDDSSIDPDYCRILFDLDLNALERTMIDMHIQNKQVSFVIYNDTPHIKTFARAFEAPLIDRLRKLDYTVSSIRYQPLQEMGKRPEHAPHIHKEIEGIDIKI